MLLAPRRRPSAIAGTRAPGFDRSRARLQTNMPKEVLSQALPWLYAIVRRPPPCLALLPDADKGDCPLTNFGKAQRGRFAAALKDITALETYCKDAEISVSDRILEISPPAWIPEEAVQRPSVARPNEGGAAHAPPSQKQQGRTKMARVSVPRLADELGQPAAQRILRRITQFLGTVSPFRGPLTPAC